MEAIMDEQQKEALADKYGTRAIHAAYLPMLDDLHSYCIKHNIQYSLSGGTLLGAVRHRGFIPWDDDVDIMFSRKDYDGFLKAFSLQPIEGYEIIESTWVKRLTRIENLQRTQEKRCIDLFVFDEVPDNAFLARLKIFVLLALQGMMKDKPQYERFTFKYRVMLFVTWLLGRPFSQNTKRKLYDRVSRIGKTGDWVNIYNTYFDQIRRTRYDEHILDGYVLLDFEGRKYMAIRGYDSYLTELYGDYMQPPPDDQRVSGHMK